jgi:polyisoprenoid-binding protein YceI
MPLAQSPSLLQLRLLTSSIALLALAALAIPASADKVPQSAPGVPDDQGFRAYVCDPARSTVAYHAIHPFAKVNGIHHAPACTVWVSPDTSAFRIHVAMPVRGFKSGIGLRDTHAMKAVDADAYPVVSFSSSAARPQAGRMGPYAVSGELKFHGITGTVATTIVPEIKDGAVVIRGGFPISLAQYQAKPPTLMGTKVRDRVDMDFELVFKL